MSMDGGLDIKSNGRPLGVHILMKNIHQLSGCCWVFRITGGLDHQGEFSNLSGIEGKGSLPGHPPILPISAGQLVG